MFHPLSRSTEATYGRNLYTCVYYNRSHVSTLMYALAFAAQDPTQTSGPRESSRSAQSASPSQSPLPSSTPIPLPPPDIKVDSYRAPAGLMFGAALTSDRAYARLAQNIGHRLSGSKGLERAIEWAIAEVKSGRRGHANALTRNLNQPDS